MLIQYTILARLTIWIVGAYAIWQGQGIIAGGPERFGSPSFAVLREVPHDPTLVWGWTLIVSGVLVLFGSASRLILVKAIGLAGVATWSLCLAKGAFAALAIPSTAPTGGKTYVAIAAICVVLIFVDERKRNVYRPAPDSSLL